MLRRRLTLAASGAALAVLGASYAATPTHAGALGVCGAYSGSWSASRLASWVQRFVLTAGYQAASCTESAWVVSVHGNDFYIWATANWRRDRSYVKYADGLPHPAYTDGTRIVWSAQHAGVWVQAGPSAAATLPARPVLAKLQLASKRVARP
jgi:hypothetical protein